MSNSNDFEIREGVLYDYIGPGGDVVIPDGVTGIGCVFNECTSLQSIIIPEGITRIEQYAFRHCTSLTEIMIPNGVTYIGSGAFFDCTNLKRVRIPSTINRLGHAFRGLKNLQEVIIECEEDDKKYAKFIGTYLFDLDDMVKYYLRDILKMNAVM